MSGFQLTMCCPRFRVFRISLACLAVTFACVRTDEAPISSDQEKVVESNPLRQGFTQRPSPDTPGLPPPIEPILSEEEISLASELALETSSTDAVFAQGNIDVIVGSYEKEPSKALLSRLRELSVKEAKAGRISYLTVQELYARYLFPNDLNSADEMYQGKFVLLSGTVSPSNMKDMADGFKLIEQNPYEHNPLLLATDYELYFVECQLAQASLQKLRDWQPIHLVASVEGKKRGDLLLRRCIVL